MKTQLEIAFEPSEEIALPVRSVCGKHWTHRRGWWIVSMPNADYGAGASKFSAFAFVAFASRVITGKLGEAAIFHFADTRHQAERLVIDELKEGLWA